MLGGLERRALSVVFSPNGKWLGGSDLVGNHLVWDLASNRRVHRFKTGHNVYSAAFSPSGRWFATQNGVFRIADGMRTVDLNHAQHAIGQSMAFSHDGKWLVGAEPDVTSCCMQRGSGRSRE